MWLLFVAFPQGSTRTPASAPKPVHALGQSAVPSGTTHLLRRLASALFAESTEQQPLARHSIGGPNHLNLCSDVQCLTLVLPFGCIINAAHDVNPIASFVSVNNGPSAVGARRACLLSADDCRVGTDGVNVPTFEMVQLALPTGCYTYGRGRCLVLSAD